jgi:uncharacterized membrane protein
MKAIPLSLYAILGFFALAFASSSYAAAIDVGPVVTDIGLQLVPIGLIGGAVLLVYLAVKAFKWVRAAMS